MEHEHPRHSLDALRVLPLGELAENVGADHQRENMPGVSLAQMLEDIEKVKSRFLRVAEKGSAQSGDATLAMDMLGDVLCCVVHDKNDLGREDLLNATVFIHGGAPEPKVIQIGPRFFVTAGPLSGGERQTCGLLEVVERNLRFSAFSLDGSAVVDGQVLAVERRTKLSVK